ncbi:MAG TPA: pyridoxal-phosphate dependent enzyme [Candidatus Saccharimonadales bacterium]|nr:pyridoxal-phosphate dependent enzyme [Candidatus Saccharimonadales bacterium]
MESSLIPIIHPQVRSLIEEEPGELFKLTELLGSPLNLVFPHIMMDAVDKFRTVLDNESMKGGTLFYAAKANKANAFLAASVLSGAGADVSSTQEFAAALGAGIRGEAISVSGPAKPPALLELAILHNAAIAIDEPAELAAIRELQANMPVKHRTRVYLRISSAESSRFGMSQQVIDSVVEELAKLQHDVQLQGFSFHVSGYASGDRTSMLRRACEAIERAHDAGLAPNHINIGGGLRLTYARPEDWNLKRALDRDFAGGVRPEFVYPYAERSSGHEQLKQILNDSKSVIESTAQKIGQPVYIDAEPGRSLLDQAGISVFRVRSVRPIGERWLVMVDGNSRHLAEFWRNSEFFIDPILVSREQCDPEEFSAAIASNTCLESDYLARRFIPFRTRPQTGDLLVFVNTAGYQMDSKESGFHRMPVPHKIVALQKNNDWHFIDDKLVSASDLKSSAAKEKQYAKSITHMIGQTPVMQYPLVDTKLKLLLKLERFNPTSSFKDRSALSMIEDAELSGKLKSGGTLIESSSGNTAESLAMIAAAKGYKFIAVVDDMCSPEKIAAVKAFGGSIVQVKTQGGVPATGERRKVAQQLANDTPGGYYTRQADNPANPEGFAALATELLEQVPTIDTLIGAVGTGGSLCGTARAFHSRGHKIHVVGVEPEGSTIFSDEDHAYAQSGSGVPAGTELPENIDRQLIDESGEVSDAAAFTTCNFLAKQLGLMVGGSAGSVLITAIKYAHNHRDQTVVALLADAGEKYLDTIFNQDWIKTHNFHDNQTWELLKQLTILQNRNAVL